MNFEALPYIESLRVRARKLPLIRQAHKDRRDLLLNTLDNLSDSFRELDLPEGDTKDSFARAYIQYAQQYFKEFLDDL